MGREEVTRQGLWEWEPKAPRPQRSPSEDHTLLDLGTSRIFSIEHPLLFPSQVSHNREKHKDISSSGAQTVENYTIS
jgi:hypothetical protein